MRRAPSAVVVALALAGALAPVAVAAPPPTLGSGLARLLQPAPRRAGVQVTMAPLAIRDAAGRVLVDVFAARGAPSPRAAAVAAGLRPVATVPGAVAGYVALDRVEALAAAPGVATVALAVRPVTAAGAVTSQGVYAQRADRLPPGIDGRGITVAALSDSFDTAATNADGEPLAVHAADDVATGDLPADGVTVLRDLPPGVGSDEGRAMLQIVHDVAPGARECFATAGEGAIAFAAAIRALADPAAGCGADVIVDDIAYVDQPFFGESVIGDAVDDVAAQGVHYVTAAGNFSESQAYAAPLRLAPPDTTGTNLDLTGVDPRLYSGGVQDFDPGPGTDIVQDIAVDEGGLIALHWDDPVDPAGPRLGDPTVIRTGALTAAGTAIPFAGSAGQTIRAAADAVPSGSADLALTLRDPGGAPLAQADRGTSPEELVATLPADGTYTLEVAGGPGTFTAEVRPFVASARTATDLNLLFFDPAGHFIGAAADLNPLSGKPFEITTVTGAGPLQLVVARSGAGPASATRLRYVMADGLWITEYVQPLAPGLWGQSLARGATTVAAYDPFRPLLPESFTSVGGDLPVRYDSAGERLPRPELRRAPHVAAADGVNTTFFRRDTVLDPDDRPNFFGTSAAAPHVAGIAALVLQAAGGPRAIGPAALRGLLQRTVFRHDLDPQHAQASRRGLTITADGAAGAERATARPRQAKVGSMTDQRFFTVRYDGPGSLVELTLDGAGANPTGLGGGIVFDPRPFLGLPLLGAPPLYEQGFPFTADGGGAVTARIGASGRRMTLTFAPGTRAVAFGVDRDEAVTAFGVAQDGNSADALGRAVPFPRRRAEGPGLRFSARTSTGRRIAGTLRNRLGRGWTAVDGHGVVDAQAAVAASR